MPEFAIIPRTSIGPLEGVVDGYPSDQHNRRVRVSSQPLEDARTASDHAVVTPALLRLQVHVSDIENTGAAAVAWEALEALLEERELLPIVTGFRVYDNMLLTGIQALRGKRTGHSLQALLTFEEILIVGLAQVDMGPPADLRPPVADRGIQSPTHVEQPRDHLPPRHPD